MNLAIFLFLTVAWTLFVFAALRYHRKVMFNLTQLSNDRSPTMNDVRIEQEIQAKGANVAPRITPADVEANIASEHFFTAAEGVDMAYPEMTDAAMPEPLKLLTFCVLVLKNGFTVSGESACASPENFNYEIGCKIARTKAIDKVWPLMGYELRSKLAASSSYDAGATYGAEETAVR